MNKGTIAIFKSPSGELYINPFSQKPVGVFGMKVQCDPSIYTAIVSAMGTSNMIIGEYVGVQNADYSLTIHTFTPVDKKIHHTPMKSIMVAIDFEYQTVYKGVELTPYQLDELNDTLAESDDKLYRDFKNELVLRPILCEGTDTRDTPIIDIRATTTTDITQPLTDLFTHKFNAQPKHYWVYNAKAEFEIIIPLLIKAGYEYNNKVDLASKKDQYNVVSKGGTYYSLSTYSYRPVYSKEAGLYQCIYIKDDYKDLFRLLGSGSLKRNVNDFKVKSYHGRPISKDEWDWTKPENNPYETDGSIKKVFVEYCRKDCVCTMNLLKEFRKVVLSTGEVLEDDLESCLTAGSIAKKVAINSIMRPITSSDKYSDNLKAFHQTIAIDKATPEFISDLEQYRVVKGGLGYFNSNYFNKTLGKVVYSDISSAYPYVMSIMPIPTFEGMVVNKDKHHLPGEACTMLIIRITRAKLRPGYAPMMYDSILKQQLSHNSNNSYFMEVKKGHSIEYGIISSAMPLLDELRLLEEAYDIDYEVLRAYHLQDSGLRFGDYINKFYQMKEDNKGVNDALASVAKLILNSSYGKMAQNLYTTYQVYELSKDGRLFTSEVALDETTDEFKKDLQQSSTRVIGGLITSMQRTRLARVAHETYVKGKSVYLLATDCIVYSFDNEADSKSGVLGDFDIEIITEFTGWSQKGYKYIKPTQTKDEKRYNLHMNGINTKAFANPSKFDEFKPGLKVMTPTSLRVEGGKIILNSPKLFNVKADKEIIRLVNLN